jgi:hypothetical protein
LPDVTFLIFTTIVPLDRGTIAPILGFAAEQIRKESAMAQGNHRLQDVVLHLPSSLRDRVEEMASRECVSLNLFVVLAVAEKLQRLQLQHCLELTEKEALQHESSADTSSLSPSDRIH